MRPALHTGRGNQLANPIFPERSFVMEKKLNKLVLNQETLKNLNDSESTKKFRPTDNSCVKSVCFPVCTPAAGIN